MKCGGVRHWGEDGHCSLVMLRSHVVERESASNHRHPDNNNNNNNNKQQVNNWSGLSPKYGALSGTLLSVSGSWSSNLSYSYYARNFLCSLVSGI